MQWVAGVGAASERSVAYVGGLAEIFGRSLRLLFLSPLKRDRMLQRAIHEAMAVGVGAIPIISLITFFVGSSSRCRAPTNCRDWEPCSWWRAWWRSPSRGNWGRW
jgi:ABC-type transporter Mla maintaining outer membrane lipid asymmetry permease subunit MlaE